MTPAKDFEHNLITEYSKSKETLISKFSGSLLKQEAKESINATFLLTSAKQATIILKELPSEYLAGIYIESDYLAQKVPAYVGFDLTKVSEANLNKITKDTIGNIGNFNKELANDLNWKYKGLLADNELINQIEAHGWTANTEKRMLKMGFDKETINLVKHQTTTNKMIRILNDQGIKGGMHPNEVSKLLQPHIRSIFGDGGVTIDNIGKIRKEIIVDADGRHKWVERKTTRRYHTTVQNYANTISSSSMLRAHRTGRLDTLHKTDFVRKWRYVSSMSANMCGQCGAMHGAILDDPYEYASGLHAKCACLGPSPIFKSETGLINHTDEYYENQRDQWFWKQHQLKKHNMTLPKGQKIPNYNFLPKDMLKGMPSKAGMRKIRSDLLGQPLKPLKAPKILAPVVKPIPPERKPWMPTVKPIPPERKPWMPTAEPKTKPALPKAKPRTKMEPPKVPKKVKPKGKMEPPKVPKKVKPKGKMKPEDKEEIDKLWGQTIKDGNEHGCVIANGKKTYFDGDKGSVSMRVPEEANKVILHHTHPPTSGLECKGLSDADFKFFFKKSNVETMTAASKTHLYKITKTSKTPWDAYGYVEKDFLHSTQAQMKSLPAAKRKLLSSYNDAVLKANKEIAKKYKCKFEIIPR